MTTYLDAILARHRGEIPSRERERSRLVEEARVARPVRGFEAALRSASTSGGVALVAELKRRSPSKGELASGLDASAVALEYAEGGATCLSVLTDGPSFGGSRDDLERARSAVSLPVLRKDFTVCDLDLYEARAMGADGALLIVAALGDGELAELHALGRSLGLDLLVEVHDEAELDRALRVGATLVGVNQRDLRTFDVDRERARRVGKEIPAGVVRVAESGIGGRADVEALAEAGFHAVLVGEALVSAADRTAAARELLGRPSRGG